MQNPQDSIKWECRESRIQILFREILDAVAYFKHVVAKHYQTQLRDLENNQHDVRKKLKTAKLLFDNRTNTIQRLVKYMRKQGRYDLNDDQDSDDSYIDHFNQQIIDIWNLDYQKFNNEIFFLLRIGSNIINWMNRDGNY